MGQTGPTASAVINYLENLEETTSEFYEELARKHVCNRDMLISFAKESKKNKVILARTYRETITDALEACFCFRDITMPKMELKKIGPESVFSDDMKLAIEQERTSASFYSSLVKCSGSLLSTITQSFRKVGQIRERRLRELESILQSEQSLT